MTTNGRCREERIKVQMQVLNAGPRKPLSAP
jgi:hypothetical protein